MGKPILISRDMVVLWQRKCSPNNAFSTSLRESLLIRLLVLVHSTIGKNHALVLRSVSASPTCYWIGILLYSCPWTISESRCILIVVYRVSSACQYYCLRSMPLGCMLFPLVFSCALILQIFFDGIFSRNIF